MKKQIKGISMAFAVALLLALILPVPSLFAYDGNDQGTVNIFPKDSAP